MSKCQDVLLNVLFVHLSLIKISKVAQKMMPKHPSWFS